MFNASKMEARKRTSPPCGPAIETWSSVSETDPGHATKLQVMDGMYDRYPATSKCVQNREREVSMKVMHMGHIKGDATHQLVNSIIDHRVVKHFSDVTPYRRIDPWSVDLYQANSREAQIAWIFGTEDHDVVTSIGKCLG
jgi:hypothetical protein